MCCLWSNLLLFDCVWTAPWVTICLQEAVWKRNGTLKCAKWYSSEYGSSVDHHVLLGRLETTFSIIGRALAWFHSYQPNRSQLVAFSDGISGTFQLTCGVPQGSCLRPLLLTLYANKLFQVIKKHSPTAHAYADDTQLYLSFKPEGNANEKECLEAME